MSKITDIIIGITRHLYNWLFYCGLNRNEFKSIANQIYSRNMKMIKTASGLVAALGYIYIIISLFAPVGNVWLYAYISIAGSISLCLSIRFKNNNSRYTLIISHFLLLCVTIYGIILSFLSGHFDSPSTSIIVFLVILPLVIIDRPLRMYFVIIVYATIFLILSKEFKTSDAFLTDLVNTVTCIFLGLVVYTINIRINVRELYHSKQIENMNTGIITSLASTIDAKDHYTSGHSQRVANYSLLIAKKMGKSVEEQRIIYTAGLLHDIGKIRVSESIINKNGRLTNQEFDQIKVHPSSGFHILKNIQSNEQIGYGAKYHHERYDGSGYPNRLEKENIPEIARIIAVADAYDAMASDRSYRKSLSQDIVRSEILKGKGTQFDPDIADIMLDIIDNDIDYNLREKDDQSYNILIVDDDNLSIENAKSILSVLVNTSIISANNENEALSIINNYDIDLIMLDINIKDIDGFSLYKKIIELQDIPTILMTGDKSKDTLKNVRTLGFTDYLTKPLNESITRETVYSILHT